MSEYIGVAERAGRNVLGDLLGPQPIGPDDVDWTPDALADYCPRCGASVDQTGQTPRGCPFCVGKPLAWDRLIRLHAYTPPIRDWILGCKFRGFWRWATALGQRLGEQAASQARERRTLVCPVPMHWTRRWRRGYNQAELLARSAAKAMGVNVAPLLRRTRYTRPQTVVAPSQRASNVRNSFSAAPVDLRGWTVWLVDDVKTSGATLHASARLLRQAGASMVNVAVVAVADPHGKDFHLL